MPDRTGPLRRAGAAVGEWAELGLEALREVRAHKMRSVLTLFGVVFGAASVVSMTSLAAALKTMAYDELRRMGMPGTFQLYDRGPRDDARRALDLRYVGLDLADVEALQSVPGAEAVYGHTWSRPRLVSTARDQRTVPVEGVDAGYLRFRQYRIVRGRDIAPLEVARAARVVVIGEELVEPYFGTEDPLGRTVSIDGLHFRVVGVVAPFELELVPADFSFLARRLYVPYTWVTRYLNGARRVDNVYVRAGAEHDFATVMRAGTELLRARHRGADDVALENMAADVAQDLAMADGILVGWNAVLYAIAGVTLVVGGIGLFSVLLIAVRERVREIGIRMALGADDRAIRRLFLAESVTLALLGAAVGIGGGVGLIRVTQVIAQQFGKNFVIPVHLPGALMAVGFAVIIGVLFGWYPASRAARLDPVEAIREL
ncbi:MAG TPA: ABC transporter permease [Gemmatimonadales bacterium]|nr:ABC transporter permease [Gemmatimonadales bacterium]